MAKYISCDTVYVCTLVELYLCDYLIVSIKYNKYFGLFSANKISHKPQPPILANVGIWR